MSERDFTFWLQGFVEITNGQPPDETQWKIIKDHLSLVFNKVTPDRYVEPTYCGQVDKTFKLPTNPDGSLAPMVMKTVAHTC